MALTMIDPASSWLEIVELPLVSRLTTKMVNCKEKVSKELIFDKSSNQIERLVNSLPAIDAHEHQGFNKLCGTVVSCRIFIRSQSLIAR
jgi:hypothetical protein